jgi:hypothetical protein
LTPLSVVLSSGLPPRFYVVVLGSATFVSGPLFSFSSFLLFFSSFPCAFSSSPSKLVLLWSIPCLCYSDIDFKSRSFYLTHVSTLSGQSIFHSVPLLSKPPITPITGTHSLLASSLSRSALTRITPRPWHLSLEAKPIGFTRFHFEYYFLHL